MGAGIGGDCNNDDIQFDSLPTTNTSVLGWQTAITNGVWEEIEENDDWIDEWSPPASVQQTTKDVQKLKTEMEMLRLELEYLKATVYKK